MRHRYILCVPIVVAACVAGEPEPGEVEDGVDDESGCPVEEGSAGHVAVDTPTGPRTLSYIVRDCHAIHETDLDLGHVSELRHRGGAARLGERWPDGVVPFYPGVTGQVCGFDDPNNCVDAKTRVRQTLAALERKIPVRFQEVTPLELVLLTNVLIFQHGSSFQATAGLSNHIGMDDEPQTITFKSAHMDDNMPDDLLYHLEPTAGTIVHETVHALGVWHEQSRRDRDDHVQVMYFPCIEPSRFADYEMEDESADIGIYDFNSIMHYSTSDGCVKDSGGNCVCPTMTTIDPGATISAADAINNRGGLSIEDTNTLFQMYTASSAGQRGQRFGHALAVGDFDADGYDDLAVGAPFTDLLSDPTTTANDAGVVFVYRGTINGPVAWRRFHQTDFSGQSVTANAQFGAAVVAYDLNGDGADDLAIGAPGAQNGAGAVFVFRGSRDRGFVQHRRLSQVNTASLPEAGDAFGAVLAAGPITGARVTCGATVNNVDTLAVGAPTDRAIGGTTPTGSVFLFHETTSTCGGLSLLNAATWLFRREARAFGSAIAIGALDSGNAADIAIGAPLTNGAGSVYLYKGVETAIPPIATFSSVIAATDPGILFGAALAIGKVIPTGFGIPTSTRSDLAVGAPGVAGRVRVFRVIASSTGVLQASLATTIFNAPVATGDEFGAAVAIGDIDRSPFPTTVDELVIGAPGDDAGRGSVTSLRIRADGTFTPTVILQTTVDATADRMPNSADGEGDRYGQAIAIGNFDGSSGLPGRDSTADTGVRNQDLAVAARGETFEWRPWDAGSPERSGTVDVTWGTSSSVPTFWAHHYLHGNYTNRLPDPQ